MFRSIAYNLHDALILTTTLEQADRFVLELALYPIYYPTEQTVQLIFSGIVNVSDVAAFHHAVSALARKKHRWCYRIEEFQYTAGFSAKDKLLSLSLTVDHLPPLIIQCTKYRFVPAHA